MEDEQHFSLLGRAESGSTQKKRFFILVITISLITVLATLLGFFLTHPTTCTTSKHVSVDNVLNCLAELDAIGTKNGNRAVNTTGYLESLLYIQRVLEANTSFKVYTQAFPVTRYGVIGTPTLQVNGRSLVYGTDFTVFEGGQNGLSSDVKISYVGEGCTSGDYFNFTAGHIALVKRGTCTFLLKGTNALAANASAIIVFNNIDGISTPTMITQIPAFFVDEWVGLLLLSFLHPDATFISYDVSVTTFEQLTWNLFAETLEGDENNTVVFGSHLDGVPAGNGINDNGSGSCLNLELALQASLFCKPTQKLVFAWWGAEEIGLRGSRYYLDSMAPEERDKIALYLNFDMMASPNYVLFIHNGTTAPEAVRNQSVTVQYAFEDYFAANDVPFALTPFSGGSDYSYFLSYGIPAGGLATGAGASKTYAQKDVFGGVALVAYDFCYHQACDTKENIDEYAMEVNLRAASSVLDKFAMDVSNL